MTKGLVACRIELGLPGLRTSHGFFSESTGHCEALFKLKLDRFYMKLAQTPEVVVGSYVELRFVPCAVVELRRCS